MSQASATASEDWGVQVCIEVQLAAQQNKLWTRKCYQSVSHSMLPCMAEASSLAERHLASVRKQPAAACHSFKPGLAVLRKSIWKQAMSVVA